MFIFFTAFMKFIIQFFASFYCSCRFLATGHSFRALGFQFRMAHQTVGKIIAEVLGVIWVRLAPVYMKVPNTPVEWKAKSANFWAKWQFPQCVGALDGKHVLVKAPANSGSQYFNYKNTFSIVLMAMVDANLQFICIDAGAYGRNSDGGIFASSNMGKGITRDQLNFPPDQPLPGAPELGPLPYVVVGDEAFPLHRRIMRPYPGRKLTHEQNIFNYRLSRARRIVENAFGLLAARWRVFHTKMEVNEERVVDIIKASCVLHNMLQAETTPAQTSVLTQEVEGLTINGIGDLRPTGNRAGHEALQVREKFKTFFNQIAPLTWQEAHVTRGRF